MGSVKKLRLKSKELCNVLEINPRTLEKWNNKDKLPRSGKGNKYLYAPCEVILYLRDYDKEEYMFRLKEWMDINCPDEVPNIQEFRDDEVDMSDVIQEENIDIFTTKDLVAREIVRVQKQIRRVKNNASLRNESRILGQLIDRFRKLETDCVDFDRELGEVIHIDQVKKIVADANIKMKTNLRTLPFSLAPELSGLDDEAEIAKIIKVAIDDCLRHLASEFDDAPDI